MDGSRFDALARALGAAMSRRRGLGAALGSAFGLALAPVAAGKPSGRRGKGEGPSSQGPCQTTRRPDNICTRDAECCTNICDINKGKSNKDKKGRCRCIRWKRPCTEDRNCCTRKNQQMACIKNICQKLVPTNHSCNGGDVCESKKASCTTYVSNDPTGTYCLIPIAGECTIDADCVNASCVNRRCLVPTGVTCGPVQDSSVCADQKIGARCTTYDDGAPAGNYCLLPLLAPCTADNQCMNERCTKGMCGAPAELAEACGDSNAGAFCITPGATCTTYTYTDAPGGTYCLLPDNINKDVKTNCEANDQCRSGQCAMVDGKGQCAPLTCNVCQPYDGVSACPYSSIQSYVDDNGSGGDITLFAGKHLGQTNLTDADWHIFPCCEDCFPEIGPLDGDSYGVVLDVNACPTKLIHLERLTFGGDIPNSHWLQAWGYTDGPVCFMDVLVDRVKTNLKASNKTFLNGSEAVRVEIRDSTMKGFFIKNGVDTGGSTPSDERGIVTLTRSTLEGWGSLTLQNAPAIWARTVGVFMANSTIKGFRQDDTTTKAAGIWLESPNSSNLSSLTMDASSKITDNIGADSQGYGIYADNGSTATTGVTSSNVFQNGGVTPVLQCSKGSSVACF